MEYVRKKIQVTGKVQGVFFRATTKNMADQLNLTGFARNEVDGSVTIEVEGLEDDVDKLIAWAHEGSTWARVDNVQVTILPIQKASGFHTF